MNVRPCFQRLRKLIYHSGLPFAWPAPFGLSRLLIRLLRSSQGVLHVGANSGQERFLYHYLQKPVLWIEPDRDSFRRLSANIRPLRGQKAIRALCWSRAGVRLPFHQTSNNGLSSSVYPLAKHLQLWPGVKPAGKVVMTTQTLDGLLFAKRRDALPYDTLILDTQGSELQILAGAGKTLKNITTIICEACNFEAYRGGCRASQVKKFLHQHGWKLLQSLPVWQAGTKAYFELLFQKQTED